MEAAWSRSILVRHRESRIGRRSNCTKPTTATAAWWTLTRRRARGPDSDRLLDLAGAGRERIACQQIEDDNRQDDEGDAEDRRHVPTTVRCTPAGWEARARAMAPSPRASARGQKRDAQARVTNAPRVPVAFRHPLVGVVLVAFDRHLERSSASARRRTPQNSPRMVRICDRR